MCLIALGFGALPVERAAAQADGEARILLVRSTPEDVSVDVREWTAGLRRELGSRGVEVREPPAARAAREEAVALETATRLYQNLQPQQAQTAVEALLGRVDASGGEGIDRDGLMRALLLFAMCQLATNDAEGADSTLDRLIGIDPAYEPDPSSYPPPLRERLSIRRAEIGADRIAVEITEVPEEAIVRVDAEALPADVRTVELLPGPHLVRAGAPGHLDSGLRIEVRAEPHGVELPLDLDAAAVLADAGAVGEPAGEERTRAASQLDATLLLLDLTFDGEELTATLVDVESDSRFTWVGSRDAGLADVAADLGRSWAGEEEEVVTPIGPPVEPPDPAPVWPWIAVGGAVAVAAAVVIGILAASGSQGDPMNDFPVHWRRIGE